MTNISKLFKKKMILSFLCGGSSSSAEQSEGNEDGEGDDDDKSSEKSHNLLWFIRKLQKLQVPSANCAVFQLIHGYGHYCLAHTLTSPEFYGEMECCRAGRFSISPFLSEVVKLKAREKVMQLAAPPHQSAKKKSANTSSAKCKEYSDDKPPADDDTEDSLQICIKEYEDQDLSKAFKGVENPIVIEVPMRPRLSDNAFKFPAVMNREIISRDKGKLVDRIFAAARGCSYSTKVFLGGLPHDTKAHEIKEIFSVFGDIKHIEWPDSSVHPVFPPNGFAFVVFKSEKSVHHLLYYTKLDENTRSQYIWFKSKTETKPIEIRPWKCEDATYLRKGCQHEKPKNLCEVFIGGIPRSFTAAQLGRMLEEHLKLSVYSAIIDVDSVHKYPKGTAKVTFGDTMDALKAISISRVSLRIGNQLKHMEIKLFRRNGYVPCIVY